MLKELWESAPAGAYTVTVTLPDGTVVTWEDVTGNVLVFESVSRFGFRRILDILGRPTKVGK